MKARGQTYDQFKKGVEVEESSAGSAINLPHNNQLGTVGPALPGTEIRIAADGEILIKGPGVMREYWKNPEASTESIKKGWLHTGDIGQLVGPLQALRITDRKKDLIVTAGGKNIAPQKIENLLKTEKIVSQVVVHGDRRKFLTALFTLDEEQLQEKARQEGLTGDYTLLSQHPSIRAELQRSVDKINAELPRHERIKKFEILSHDFSIETGELTPKLSVKRKVITSKYGHLLDELYGEKF